MTRDSQIKDLEQAYCDFVEVANSVPVEAFLRPLADWTARDVVAHLIGWNRNILIGCRQLQEGISPFYYNDGPNDYRKVNAESIERYNSKDRGVLLQQLAQSKDELISYLREVNEQEWDLNRGPQHYRGGPATIGRSIDSLARDYINHTSEITDPHSQYGSIIRLKPPNTAGGPIAALGRRIKV